MLILVIVGIVVFILIFVILYNGLVTLRNRFKNAFAQIDVQLKRRYDLIPNLVETSKGYLKHERETLEAVVAARNQAVSAASKVAADPTSAGAMRELGGSESLLGGALGRLLAVVESYPDLKANQNMAMLMEELTSTENKISFARQAYNDAVTVYNTTCEKIPSNIIASLFNFSQAAMFEVTKAEEKEAVKVTF